MGKLNVEMSEGDFARNMQIFLERSKRPISSMLRELSVMFVQSAAKDVPASKDKKRKVVPVLLKFEKGNASCFFNRKKTRGEKGEHQRYALVFKGRNAAARRKRAGLFKTAKEARNSPWAQIKYRGAGKAGFWLALRKLRASLPASIINRATLERRADFNEVDNKSNNFPAPFIEVKNKVKGIERYVGNAVAWARTKVNNRMRYLSGMTQEEIEKAGGKIFNTSTRRWG